MHDAEHFDRSFDIDLYRESQSNVLRLKEQLPKEAVNGIVLEVLNRVRSNRTANANSVNNPSRAKVEKLCYALISEDPSEGAMFISEVQKEGATLDAIYLSYLAEAASILGEWWEDDHASFYEVMIGTSRIYSIVRSLSYLFTPDRPVEVKSAVFASVPDETHVLGVRMAADLLGKEGWDITLLTGLSHDDLLEGITHSGCRLVGISAGGRHAAASLAKLVIALRIASPATAIFVSGQITRKAPDLLALMDLDGTAEDIETAAKVMNRLWQRKGGVAP
jgi:methanogenic corrinoid protein MtbC1